MGEVDSASRSAGRQICLIQLSIPIISHSRYDTKQFENARARPPRIPLRLPLTNEICD